MQHKLMTLLAAAFHLLAGLLSITAASDGLLHGAVISQSSTFTYFKLVGFAYKKIEKASPGSVITKACAMGPATIVQDKSEDGTFQVEVYKGKGDRKTIKARLFCADNSKDLVDARFFYSKCSAVNTPSGTGSNVVTSYCDTVQGQ